MERTESLFVRGDGLFPYTVLNHRFRLQITNQASKRTKCKSNSVHSISSRPLLLSTLRECPRRHFWRPVRTPNSACTYSQFLMSVEEDPDSGNRKHGVIVRFIPAPLSKKHKGEERPAPVNMVDSVGGQLVSHSLNCSLTILHA